VGLAALCAGVTLLAFIFRQFSLNADLRSIGEALLNTNGREAAEGVAAAAVIILAFAAPRFGRKGFGRIEQQFSAFAADRPLAILTAGLFPAMLRLSLLPALPIPVPRIADEFGHLLLADTFASGRITNPTHPMWRYFESLYIFHQPTYSSVYPVAQGFMMAIPAALRLHPWFGVVMGVGLMCAALCWMLEGWLPPKWALLGAVIAGLRFDLVTSWINSYWGGATAALGGALLMGAMPRLVRKARIRDALFACLGLAILSQTRPFEGILLSLPVGMMLLSRLLTKARVLAPLVAGSAIVVAGGLYYNSRVTGHAMLLPYQLHQRIYGTPQNLLWNPPVVEAARLAQAKDIRDNFDWQLGLFEDQATFSGFAEALQAKFRSFWDFYLQPILSVPLLLLPLVLRRHDMRFLFWTCLFVLLADFLLYPFFFPHYAAPLSGPLLVLVLQGARYLRTVRWRGERVGDAAFRWFAVAGAISSVLLVTGAMLSPGAVVQASTPRSRIQEELLRRGGKHLVLVRYTPRHNFQEPWIYNASDVDRSPVVWAREEGEAELLPLLGYYSDRQVWTVNADAPNPKLRPYGERNDPQISTLQNAAGKSEYVPKGVSPGSLVTVFGSNLGNQDVEGCVVSGLRNRAAGGSDVKLPGLDASRPGFAVSGRQENLPRFAVGQSVLNAGAAFLLAGGRSVTPASSVSDPKALSVRFGDLPAQVLCVQESGDGDAATVQVPQELHGEFVNVSIRREGQESVEKHFPVVSVNPGILQASAGGKRAGLLLRPDGSLVTPQNRARRGEVLRMFVTGFGPFNQAAPKNPLIVGVHDRGAPLEFVNCAECSSGILELGFQVPSDTPKGDQASLSVAVVVEGKPVYSNASVVLLR